MQSSRTRRTLRQALPVAVVAAVAVVPASASAAKAKPAKLTVTALGAPPANLKPGQRFTVTGKVKNTGGKSTPALIAFELRSKGGRTVRYAIGGDQLRKVAKGSTRTFKARVSVASTAVLKDDTSFLLAACVKRTRRDGQLSCRKASKATAIPATPAAPAAPAAPPAPATPATPATPAAPATPSEPTRRPVFTPGARTLDDTLFPTIGNGGYDAQHYALDLDYVVASKVLEGTATVSAVATQNLANFSLDLTEWNVVSAVTVDGEPATFRQDATADKLIVTPPVGIPDGESFTTTITYRGVQQPYIDPDGSQEGFVPSTTYGAIVASEPVGAMGWYPNNNVPFDKASYTTRMTVPAGFSVVGTGVLKDRTSTGTGAADTSTFVWDEPAPTASYLFAMAIGRFDLSSPDPASPTMTTQSSSLNPSVPFYTAVESSFTTGKATILERLAETPKTHDFYADFYGVAYPFSAAGGIVPRQNVFYSLETQGKPTYATQTRATSVGPDPDTIAHENGHMWFGDDVTLTQWKDIWLNEGMTEFSSRLYDTRVHDGTPMEDRFLATYNQDDTDANGDGVADAEDFWLIPSAAPPTAADIFDYSAMYERGATTMEAIREILGEATFRTMMHSWLTTHAYGNATTEQFIALVKETDPARADRWTEFFRQWLYTSYPGTPSPSNRPQISPANFDAAPTR
jgi:hypothetical protein